MPPQAAIWPTGAADDYSRQRLRAWEIIRIFDNVMKEILAFQFALHNDRVWFCAHKAEYLSAAARINDFSAGLIEGIRTFNDTIEPLTPKDCTYRIYRDICFSKDKSLYKTHMGVYINRGGKKSGYSGYYFHVGAKATGHIVNAPFPVDSPNASFFNLKYFGLGYAPDTRFVTSQDLKKRLLDIFPSGKPFLDPINLAVEYAQEEQFSSNNYKL